MSMNYVNPNFGSGYKAYLELKEKMKKVPQKKLDEIAEKMNEALANDDKESKYYEEYYPDEKLESGNEETETPQCDESEKAYEAMKQVLEEKLDKQEEPVEQTEAKEDETTHLDSEEDKHLEQSDETESEESTEDVKPKKKGRKKKVTEETSDDQAEA